MDKPATGAGDKPEPKKSKKKVLVIGAVAAVVLLGGAKTMLGGGAGAAEASGTTTSTTAAPGPVEVLDPVTLNLADGHYLKVGIAVQLHGSEGAEEGAGEDPRTKWAKALDLVISVLGRRTFGELVDPNGRDVAKRELEEHLREAYPDVVETLYFTEFVLQ